MHSFRNVSLPCRGNKFAFNSPSSLVDTSLDAIDRIAIKDVPLTISTMAAGTRMHENDVALSYPLSSLLLNALSICSSEFATFHRVICNEHTI